MMQYLQPYPDIVEKKSMYMCLLQSWQAILQVCKHAASQSNLDNVGRVSKCSCHHCQKAGLTMQHVVHAIQPLHLKPQSWRRGHEH